MTKDEIQKVRDALCDITGAYLPPYYEAIAILDAALAAPEPKPVGCEHKRYSVDVHEQTGTCYDCGADGRMRFVVDAPARQMPEPAAPEPQPMQWIDVSERVPSEAQIVLFVLRGKVVVGAWIAGIFWYDNAKQVATAWMPLPPPPEFGVGGYPITAPPSREWQGLTDQEIEDASPMEMDRHLFGFAHAISEKLRTKNTGER